MQLSNDLTVNILDVIEFSRGKGTYHTCDRPFSALSLRLEAQTVINYKNGKIELNTGDISFFPDNVAYTSNVVLEKMIVVHFDILNFVSDKIQKFSPEKPEEFSELFYNLLSVWKEKKPGYQFKATSIFYLILSKIAEQQPYENTVKTRYINAVEFIKSNFPRRDFSISELSANAGVCEAIFRRSFKQQFGISPKEYLDKTRIEYAVSLIRTGYFTHEEIASRCGFSDVKYFRTVFKKKTGICLSKFQYSS